jgi:hypothetical protein
MKKLIIILLAFSALPIFSQSVNHKPFDSILQKYVSTSGVVDYTKMKAATASLKKVIDDYSKVKTSNLSNNECLAYYINLYNAHTVYMILTKMPVKSVKDIDAGKPWDTKRILLNGKMISLNQLENNIIRPEFKEPRIHFALNCGAASCPALLNKAYMASTLQSQLEAQTKAFINNVKFNNQTSISQIFNWYKEDFGDVVTYLNKYLVKKLDPKKGVTFMEYDWKLNGK